MFFDPKVRNVAPIAGAALLALSPFTRPVGLAAAETAPAIPALAPNSQKTETRYNGSDLIALTRFVDLVATCDGVWPSNGYRYAVLSQLQKNGTLRELSLSASEQDTLLQVARYGTEAVHTSIAAARVNARGSRTVTQADLFKLLGSAFLLDTPEPGTVVGKALPDAELRKGVSLALLLKLHSELINPDDWKKERTYLRSLEGSKRTDLSLLMGALLLQRDFDRNNPDYPTLQSFIRVLGKKVTDTDRKNIPFLQTIPKDESRLTIFPLVGAAGIAAGLLWRRAARKNAAGG